MVEANKIVQEAKDSDLSMSFTTMTKHLEVSMKPPQHKKLKPLIKRSKKIIIKDMLNMKTIEEENDTITQLFFAHGLPFHIARSPYFKKAFKKTKLGPSYALHS